MRGLACCAMACASASAASCSVRAWPSSCAMLASSAAMCACGSAQRCASGAASPTAVASPPPPRHPRGMPCHATPQHSAVQPGSGSRCQMQRVLCKRGRTHLHLHLSVRPSLCGLSLGGADGRGRHRSRPPSNLQLCMQSVHLWRHADDGRGARVRTIRVRTLIRQAGRLRGARFRLCYARH